MSHASAGESVPASTCRGHVRHTLAGGSIYTRSRNLYRLCRWNALSDLRVDA
ncbi:hypothetical protein AHAS_Ahas06G0167900 [Arachis hypogaea]